MRTKINRNLVVSYLVFFGLMILFCPSSFAAEIVKTSSKTNIVTKGDLVELGIEAGNSASKVEWWHDGEIFCEALICKVDTSNFSPGEYRYEVVVHDAEGIATTSFSVSAMDAPPLYKSKTLGVMMQNQRETIVNVRNGEWLIVLRAGVAVCDAPSRLMKGRVISSLGKANSGQSYSVLSGSQAIVRRIGFPEQWMLSGGSKFKVFNNQFELLEGSAIFRRVDSELADQMVSPDTNAPMRVDANLSSVRIQSVKFEFGQSNTVSFEVKKVSKEKIKLTIRNIEGDDVSIFAHEERKTVLPSKAEVQFFLDSRGNVVNLSPVNDAVRDPTAILALWYPWWLRLASASSADRWRAEWRFIKQENSSVDSQIDIYELINKKRCGEALDFLSGQLKIDANKGPILAKIAECQFALQMYEESISTLREFDKYDTHLAWSFLVKARAFQKMKKHREAQNMFLISDQLGYADRAEIGRDAEKSAYALGESKSRLRWLELITLTENDGKKILIDVENAESWRRERPAGGVVKSLIVVDGQALPMNSKISTPTPLVVKSSRDYVIKINGQWWQKWMVSSDLRFSILGQHELSKSKSSDVAIADTFSNHITGDLELVEQMSRPWGLNTGAKLGTIVSGNERQVDHFGWYLTWSRSIWKRFRIGIQSDKYLDPKPGGSDVIDVYLNKYSGAADHSHIDQTINLSLGDRSQNFSWEVEMNIGNVDYRTGLMDDFDHSLYELKCSLSRRMNNYIEVGFFPVFLNRKFSGEAGSDQVFGSDVEIGYNFAPLWKAAVTAGLQKRSFSSDEATTWLRQIYGAGIHAEL